MKNLKIQTRSGVCGIYNLANLLADKNIIDLYEFDEKFIPCGNGEINKILEREGYTLRVEPVITSFNWSQKIPFDYFKHFVSDAVKFSKTLGIIPFILQVQCTNGERGLHAITLLVKGDKVALSDPRNRCFERINIDEIQCKYKYVNMISCLVKDNEYQAFEPESFNELFD